ncbi:MAG: YifB family Mg chelatase-like AAA ATPase [Pseudomonadota bacterium]|jgi:magnesium chelatase family protein
MRFSQVRNFIAVRIDYCSEERVDMFATAKTSCIVGLDAVPVQVEVSMKEGDKKFSILGLGGTAVRESRERIVSALEMSGLDVPPVILVNLAPAEVRKDSACFDLPIALALACAIGALPQEALLNVSACGELSLSGEVKHTTGIAAHALSAVKQDIPMILVPDEDGVEAAVVEGVTVIGVRSLAQAIRVLKGAEVPEPKTRREAVTLRRVKTLDDVLGQHVAKRALTIAAAGGHNLLMIGPPGCGKSMLAERLPTLLPPLNTDDMLEVLRIHSVAGQATDDVLAGVRPVRTPHYVVSDAGLIGGGAGPRPGEVSLAHHGVLFLDEFPEFRRSAVEALRSPMETGWVQIARAKASVNFPARFQLIAAMNPCPCGRFGSGVGVCRCSHHAVRDYLAKLSQPILDRIDLHVELEAVNVDDLIWAKAPITQGSDVLIASVLAARERQILRQGVLNSQLADGALRAGVKITDGARMLLTQAISKIGISARGFTRVLRVAATIADLSGQDSITEDVVAEAVSYRSLDRLASIIHGRGVIAREPHSAGIR